MQSYNSQSLSLQLSHQPSADKVWKACLYVRLSKDDGDKPESDSIGNQRALIQDYVAARPELHICSERVDDGFSGVNFARPGFMAMMDDIKAGLVNCVIVKDLSRFGRNWIEAGRYVEQIFPFMGVRFIAINDNYDSELAKAANDNITLPFKNLINDAYARDISIKTKTGLEAKSRKGDFIGSFAVYGYAKDSENRNQLIVDDYAAAVVRDIFKWRIGGMSNQGIANKLNEMGILSPLEYKRWLGHRLSTPFKAGSGAAWSSVAVGRILGNEVYLGVLEQGKRTSKSHKIKKREDKPKEEWIRVDGAHEAIVSQKEFDLVAELLAHDVRVAPSQDAIYLFSGLLKCHECGENMVRKLVPSRGKKFSYYVCSTNKRKKGCKPRSISETKLEWSILQSIREHIGSIAELERMLAYVETLPLKQRDVQKLDGQIAAKKGELLKYQKRKARLYEDLQDEIINRAEYEEYKADFSRLCDDAEKALLRLNAEIEDIINNRTSEHKWISYFKEHSDIESLSRAVLVKLIDKILVEDGKRIQVLFRYQYQFNRAFDFLGLLWSEENGESKGENKTDSANSGLGLEVAAYGT